MSDIFPVGLAVVAALMPVAAQAQVNATIDPERTYTWGDNQAIINNNSTYDGTSNASGLQDLYVGSQSTTLLTGGGGLLPSTFDA